MLVMGKSLAEVKIQRYFYQEQQVLDVPGVKVTRRSISRVS